jgi:hypothetical protein
VGEAHRRYTNFVNARGRWTGHLFQSGFLSVAMDEDHPIAAVRDVSLNPLRARRTALIVGRQQGAKPGFVRRLRPQRRGRAGRGQGLEQKQNKMLDGDSTAVSVTVCGIGLQLRAVFDIVDRKE